MRRRTTKRRVQRWFGRRTRRDRLYRIVRIVLYVVAVFLFFIGIAHLPLISVRSVEVHPDSTVTGVLQDDVVLYVRTVLDEYQYVIPGSTWYFFRKGAIEEMLLERFLYIDAVTVEWEFFNRWVVLLSEREVFGSYCDDRYCFLIDQSGLVFSRSDAGQVGFDVRVVGDIGIGEHLFDDAGDSKAHSFEKTKEIITFLEEELGLPVEFITVREGGHDVHVRLLNGIGIWINTVESIHSITRALYVAFSGVFPDEESRAEVSSLAVCDPLRILWKPGQDWDQGCSMQDDAQQVAPTP